MLSLLIKISSPNFYRIHVGRRIFLCSEKGKLLSSARPSDLVAGAEFRHLFFYLIFPPLNFEMMKTGISYDSKNNCHLNEWESISQRM